MYQELSWPGESRAAKCWSRQLRQEPKIKVTRKPLTIWAKGKSTSFLSDPFFPHGMHLVRSRCISTKGEIVLLLREHQTKGSCYFVDLGPGGGKRGKARRGKGMSSVSEWGRASLRSLPPISDTGVLAEVFREGPSQGPLMRRLQNGGVWTWMQIRLGAWLAPARPESLTATSFWV